MRSPSRSCSSFAATSGCGPTTNYWNRSGDVHAQPGPGLCRGSSVGAEARGPHKAAQQEGAVGRASRAQESLWAGVSCVRPRLRCLPRRALQRALAAGAPHVYNPCRCRGWGAWCTWCGAAPRTSCIFGRHSAARLLLPLPPSAGLHQSSPLGDPPRNPPVSARKGTPPVGTNCGRSGHDQSAARARAASTPLPRPGCIPTPVRPPHARRGRHQSLPHFARTPTRVAAQARSAARSRDLQPGPGACNQRLRARRAGGQCHAMRCNPPRRPRR
eukprot:scaffold1782_cov414-Prasinococcus_capsulatus_cf.AAC.1